GTADGAGPHIESTYLWSLASGAATALWSFAWLAAGGFVGFLFGISKTEQTDTSANASDGYRQRINTNLEQISDWFTKIIVGIGLINLKEIGPHIKSIAHF